VVKCSQCGTESPAGTKFCPNCGTNLLAPPAAPEPPSGNPPQTPPASS
jgi:hypothetical protein